MDFVVVKLGDTWSVKLLSGNIVIDEVVCTRQEEIGEACQNLEELYDEVQRVTISTQIA